MFVMNSSTDLLNKYLQTGRLHESDHQPHLALFQRHKKDNTAFYCRSVDTWLFYSIQIHLRTQTPSACIIVYIQC